MSLVPLLPTRAISKPFSLQLPANKTPLKPAPSSFQENFPHILLLSFTKLALSFWFVDTCPHSLSPLQALLFLKYHHGQPFDPMATYFHELILSDLCMNKWRSWTSGHGHTLDMFMTRNCSTSKTPEAHIWPQFPHFPVCHFNYSNPSFILYILPSPFSFYSL